MWCELTGVKELRALNKLKEGELDRDHTALLIGPHDGSQREKEARLTDGVFELGRFILRKDPRRS
jgi:hypothetical protein